MPEKDPFIDAIELINLGKHADALAILHRNKAELQRADAARYYALLAEQTFYVGDFAAASRHSERLLKDSNRPLARATAHHVLGEIFANQLDFESSLSQFSAARAALIDTDSLPLSASVELGYWHWFLGVLPLESAESEFASVRRAVIAGGDPHHFAALRLCAARMEARKGNLVESERHWAVAKRLLEESPNAKLASQLWLDACLISVLRGDLRGALEHIDHSLPYVAMSGYFRTKIAAQIDRGHILVALGNTTEARNVALDAVRASLPYPQLHVAALDCLGGILTFEGNIEEAERVFERIAQCRPKHGSRLAPHWDVLSELSSRLSLAKAKSGGTESEALVAEGLRTATNSMDRAWLLRMQLALAEIRLKAGDVASATDILSQALQAGAPSPEMIARASAVKGLAAFKRGDKQVAALDYARGIRIARAMENAALAADVRGETELLEPTHTARLDDSIALLELAGYPHVLAREAYALLELTGAVEAMALVARGESGVRAIATHNWDDAGAIAAAPADALVIGCGSHRDEAWEIVARLKPSLDDRCTGVAIRKLVDTAVTLDRYRREEKQRAALWPPDTLETDGGLWISEQMTELLSLARRIAPADISVLLTGETGTGKEVMARAIHRASGRGSKPFVPFNCTAVPREMLESQLFGYRKGAFTGAHNAFDGVIRAAAGGTLFLDEIAEIGPDLQPKLLRFLETKEVHGLGEPQPIKVDVRVVAATNADLEALVGDGRFREDLFYRLNVVRLRLPPLRERREEIPPLVEHYLRTFADQQKKGRLTLDDETLEYLVLYRWPGNVRQLVNEISRVVAYAEPDSTITPALLSPEVQASRRTVRVLPGEEPEIRVRLDQPLGDAVDAIERVMIIRALERARGNYENAARLLGISRKGLFLKRRRWGMQRQAS